MRLLYKIIWSRGYLTALACCAVVASALLMLFWNAQLSEIIDTVSSGALPQGGAIALALATMLVMGAASYAGGWLSGFACEYMAHDLRMGYARYFASLPAAAAEQLNTGEQLSLLQNEIADVAAYLNGNLFPLFGDCVRFIATICWLSYLNVKLAISANLPVIAILLYVFYSSKLIETAVKKSQQAKERMNRHADIILTAFPIIKLYDAARAAINGYRVEVGEWERQTVKSERIRARLMSFSGLISNIPLILLFFIGGGMVMDGALSIGALYVFVNLSGNVSGVMMNMPGFISAFRQFSANMDRLSDKVL